MKIFLSESLVDYQTYTFNYAVYCRQDNEEEITSIYRKGFLPYRNHTELTTPHYYLARSLRVNLSEFKPSSENRRVDRKIQVLSPQLKVVDKKDFEKNNAFEQFCLDYVEKRFNGAMTKEHFDYVYNWVYLNKIFVFTTTNDKILGYVFAVQNSEILHYWFSFYDVQYSGLGKWMMFSVIEWAKNNRLKEVYLGTCYGEKAMYKIRDFKALSFFNGNEWSTDMKLLKKKCKSDKDFTTDDFKQNIG